MVAVLCCAARLGAQPSAPPLPPDTLALGDLRAFAAPGANWRVVADAAADRARPLAVTTTPGAGVLVGAAAPGPAGDLRTAWAHGDLELAFDVLLPQGGDATVYLQGRYPVRLTDSWRARRPTAAGMGAAGSTAPRLNAARAPGLWQTLTVHFRAPRIDSAGRKTADAQLVRLTLNGTAVQERVQLPGPAADAPFADERAAGPLVWRVARGPVAFRRVRYKRFGGGRVQLAGVRYRAYQGEIAGLATAAAGTPARGGPAESIASGLAGASDKFALAFDGTLRVPAAGPYRFALAFDWVDDDPQFKGTVVGGGRLTVDGREVLLHEGRLREAAGVVPLAAGDHAFALTYYKMRPWTGRTGTELWVEGPGVERQALHAERPPSMPGAITVTPDGEPVVLRSFFRVTDDDKRTHAAAVGDPAGVHYGVDLARGALLAAWRGPFAEATDMWHERGNGQSVRPLGSVLALPGAPALAVLAADGAAWPDSLGADAGFAFRGYALDAAGRPTFRYQLRDVEVEDDLRPAPDSASLRRELRLRGPDAAAGLYARLASGRAVRRLTDGAYLVDAADGSAYYVAPEDGTAAVVRAAPGGQELVAPVRLRGGAARVAYTLTW